MAAPGLLAEDSIAVAGEARGSPTRFDGRLGQGHGNRHDVDPTKKFADVAALDPVGLGHVVEPGRIAQGQAGATRDLLIEMLEAEAFGEDLLVDLEDQWQHDLQENLLARGDVVDEVHVGRHATHHDAGDGNGLVPDFVDPETGRRQRRIEEGGGAIDIRHRRKGDRTLGGERHRRGCTFGLGDDVVRRQERHAHADCEEESHGSGRPS